MEVKIRHEAGYEQAIEGIGYSFSVKDFDRLETVADKLAHKDGGHNKFLESLTVWIEITAARYWWQEFDTYRVGMTKQSESTIHTIARKKLTQEDFEHEIFEPMLDYMNHLINQYNGEEYRIKKNMIFNSIKSNLPEGYLQKRMVCTNYKTLKNMVNQRYNHRLMEWRFFIQALKDQLNYPEFIFVEV